MYFHLKHTRMCGSVVWMVTVAACAPLTAPALWIKRKLALNVRAVRKELNFPLFHTSYAACHPPFKSNLIIFYGQLCSLWRGAALWDKGRLCGARGSTEKDRQRKRTHTEREITKYLQHLPSTELQNSGVRWHCNSSHSPVKNHAASDGDHSH